MKIKFEFFLIAALILTTATLLLPGCATKPKPTDDANAALVQRLSYGAASIGTQLALLENPTYRPAFELAYANLNGVVTGGAINGVVLRNILADLPIDELKSPEAKIAITSATVLFDSLTGKDIPLDNNVYVVAAATGIRDGMKVALGK